MKLELLQKIIKKKQNKSEFAIVTDLSTGESEIFEKNKNLGENLEKYIVKHSDSISQVQKDLIKENLKLGEIKKMQISIIQSNFLQFTIKTLKIRKILEIGTFTGFSTLSMALALPNDGEIVTLDKNEKTNSVALKFFKMAKELFNKSNSNE